MALDIPGIEATELAHSSVLELPLVGARFGIMHHYDDSSSDAWSLKWFQDPKCKNGYTWIVMDDGRIVELADPAKRTPHAGRCLTPNANSVFYGVCIATNGRTPATPAQFSTIVDLDVALFRFHARDWPKSEVAKRIRGHHEERIYNKVEDPEKPDLWGKTGKKADPVGIDPKTGALCLSNPVLDLDKVRAEVSRRLQEAA